MASRNSAENADARGSAAVSLRIVAGAAGGSTGSVTVPFSRLETPK